MGTVEAMSDSPNNQDGNRPNNRNRTTNIGRIGVWTGVLDALPIQAAREAAIEVDELGYGALWVPETVGRDPFVLATMLLEATERVALATGIANIYARDPMTTANIMRTLEEAHPGRFLMGLGVSHHTLVSWVRKHEYSKPLSYMRDYLEMMQASLWRAGVGPRELPNNLVLAALGPKMLKLAADQTAGAHPYFTTPEHTALARDVMGPDALLAPEQMCVLDTNPDSARETARNNMAVYLGLPNYANNLKRLGFTEDDLADGGSDDVVDAVVVWGDEATVAERVSQHHDAGADHVCVQVLTPDPADAAAARDGWRRLAPALGGV